MKIKFIFLLPLVLSSSGLVGQSSIQKNEKRPNIIFILTDDLGYGDIGVFFQNQRKIKNVKSEPWMSTPNLDKMASMGAMLTDHYCSASVCAPSRASLLSGLHQGHANVRDNQFDKAVIDNHTLGRVLQMAGYATAAVGKWGVQGDEQWDSNGSEWPAHPLNRGFDYFYGYMRHVDGHEHYPKEGLYRGKKEVYENRKEVSSGLDKSYTTDLWTAAAKNWIIKHKMTAQDQPFFMYLAYDSPHVVLELPTQEYPKGGGLDGGMKWIGESGRMINTASGKIDSWIHPDYVNATYDHDNNAYTPEIAWPETYKRYATMVRRIDDAVGDIFQLLKDLKIDSNTMVVFTSDNGPEALSFLPKEKGPSEPTFFNSFGPFDGIKRDLWEGGLRVPALVSWKGTIPEGKLINHPSMFSDWMATFCDAANLPIPASIDGVSLVPSLTGVGKQKTSVLYSEYFQEGMTPKYDEFEKSRRGVKRGQMQWIRLLDYVGIRYNIQSADDDFEIYNIKNDPKQTNNLASKGKMQDLQMKMKERVLQVRRPEAQSRRPYDETLIPDIENAKVRPGLSWRIVNGDFPWIPEISNLKVDKRGKAERPDLQILNNQSEGVVYYEGYIQVPVDGAYTFHLTADSRSILRIHDMLVIDADYGYKGGTEKTSKVFLQRGLHPIHIYYMNRQSDKKMLKLEWEFAGKSKAEIPSKVFFHHK